MGRFGALQHGTECALFGNHLDLFVRQREAEKVSDFPYTLKEVLKKITAAKKKRVGVFAARDVKNVKMEIIIHYYNILCSLILMLNNNNKCI